MKDPLLSTDELSSHGNGKEPGKEQETVDVVITGQVDLSSNALVIHKITTSGTEVIRVKEDLSIEITLISNRKSA
jgi:hypothetical protein